MTPATLSLHGSLHGLGAGKTSPFTARPASTQAFLSRRASSVRCSTSSRDTDPEPSRWPGKVALPMAGVLAAGLLLSATVPGDALAARSGGRVGGSAFRSAPSAPQRSGGGGGGSGPSVRNYNYYSSPAPPLVSPFGGYGYGGYGYGGGGISIFPSFGVPIFGGGFFNIIFFMFVASAVLGVVRNLTSRRRDDDFDD